MAEECQGVLLLNMGGPDSEDDVAPFLYNLFSDREIIRLGPPLLQKPLAWLISRRRAPKSRVMYSKIGGGSPLRRLTLAQAAALQQALSQDGRYLVRVAMRYWSPRVEKALEELVDLGAKRLVALPLYPHYSRATSGSSFSDLRRAHHRIAPHLPLREIPSWPDQPQYILALAETIRGAAEHFGGDEYQLVYSAHSLPAALIRQGDPYVEELHRTIATLEKETGIIGRLCYQSRSGPVEWLSPSTSDFLETLAAEGCRNILMVPISFVSDHVETLYEVKILFTEKARELGMRLVAAEALNTTPMFIACLRALVLEAGKSSS